MLSLSSPNDTLAFSYLELRRAIGIIGLALPVAVVIGEILLGGRGLESSLSAYYYTPMRDFFVGCLCAIGVFLLSYRGPERRDAVAGTLACIFALGVALFPCTPPTGSVPRSAAELGALHYVCAALLFLTFAFFCLFLFRLTTPGGTPTPRKRSRNRIYAACGYVILGCIVLLGVVALLPVDAGIRSIHPVFLLETIAVWAFGLSWLIKGETLLRDKSG